MRAIFKREMAAYLTLPAAYVFVAVYWLFCGYFFFYYNLYQSVADMRSLFSTMFTVTLFLIPILVMRSMSEERKMKTDQLLYMVPLSSLAVILGKYLAAVCVYLAGVLFTCVCAFVVSRFAFLETAVVAGHVLGLVLLGCALIAVCMLVSSLTESQVIAAVGGFCISFFLMLLDTVAKSLPGKVLPALATFVSFNRRYQGFTYGVLAVDDTVFFVSVAALFLALCVLVFDRRRWE